MSIMRAAFAVGRAGLDAQVEDRFGRAEMFTVVDLDSGENETIAGPGISASGGAGVATAQALAGRGVEAVVAGNFGPNAVAVLQASGIKCYQCAGRSVAETVELIRQGRLDAADRPTVPGHHGLRQTGRGSGGDGGRGRGGQ
jgi:predicted Fe-Mo cluster-binding NifX family protein